MIDLLYDEYGALRPGVDLAPLTVSKHTKLARISYVLRMLGASTVFVLDEGKFFGVLTRVAMFQVEKELFDQIERERSMGEATAASGRRDGRGGGWREPASKVQCGRVRAKE